MKLLFFAERVNIDFFKGDSLLLKQMAESLSEKGNEVHALCHGSSKKIKVHSPGNFWLYTKVFSFPLTSFLCFRKFISLMEKNNFDAVVLKLPSCSSSGFWSGFPSFFKSRFYLNVALELKKRKVPFFVFLEGITEKDSFVSFFSGCSKEIQLEVMEKSNGTISLSEIQNNFLSSFGLKNHKTFFPAPVDTEKYFPRKKNFKLDLSAEKINLLYLSSSCDLKDFVSFFPFLKSNNCVLHVISPFAFPGKELAKEIKKHGLEKKVVFLKGFSNKFLFRLIPFFDAGVYLKKFNLPFADASYMMKISEYLSCGLPVLVPKMQGPLLQTGKAGINFEEKKSISKEKLKKLSFTARETAVQNLGMKKNIIKLQKFFEENI